MSSHHSIKYSRLSSTAPPEEPTFEFSSAFTYEDPSTQSSNAKYDSINSYASNWRYHDTDGRSVMLNMGHDVLSTRDQGIQPDRWLIITSMVLTFLSYLFFILTAPVSYWILVKKMGEYDRIVIFRLGKMVGVRGPGRVLVFPWMDRTKKVDVRASAFAVPPQQLITADGGIVEMGAEIQYTIVDVVTMISEVADHQEILRSLGKTLLVKTLVKKTIQQLERDKRIPAGEIQDEVNDQVRKWGIDIQAVSLSEPKILKAPDNGSTSAMGSILKGLGMKGESKYPTPEEFVRTSHGLETPENDPMMLGGGISAPASMMMPQAHQQVASSGAPSLSNMGMLQMLSSGAMPSGVNQVQLGPGIVQPENNVSGMSISCVGPDKGNGDIASVCNWGKCLDIILQKEFSGPLEEDACGLYELEITETECGKDKYWIEIQQTSKVVRTSNEEGRTPDVSVSVSSPDLSSILEGTLAPLQAYLTGRISASGDVRKLMLFDKLSKRGHKPGTMFNI